MTVERVGDNSAGALKSFIERIETLNNDKSAVSGDIREVFAEAKGSGFDPKIMRIIIRRRAMDAAYRNEQDALVDTYSAALGMLPPDEGENEEPNGD